MPRQRAISYFSSFDVRLRRHSVAGAVSQYQTTFKQRRNTPLTFK
ncbi:hypothetical protein HMPREF0208_02125 [Citrobacter koseri]|nr:hypothetical protein HMPREF0208_02125 [Citrobacter koseri]